MLRLMLSLSVPIDARVMCPSCVPRVANAYSLLFRRSPVYNPYGISLYNASEDSYKSVFNHSIKRSKKEAKKKKTFGQILSFGGITEEHFLHQNRPHKM